MLHVIAESLAQYETQALVESTNVGVNVGANVGEEVLLLLRSDPTLSAAAIAVRLGKTSRTVERQLADLKAAGRVRREGPPKSGRWVVLDPAHGSAK